MEVVLPLSAAASFRVATDLEKKAQCQAHEGDFARAYLTCEVAARLFRDIGEEARAELALARGCVISGRAAFAAGDFDSATRRFKRASLTFETVGEGFLKDKDIDNTRGYLLLVEGRTALLSHRFAEAVKKFKASAPRFHAADNIYMRKDAEIQMHFWTSRLPRLSFHKKIQHLDVAKRLAEELGRVAALETIENWRKVYVLELSVTPESDQEDISDSDHSV